MELELLKEFRDVESPTIGEIKGKNIAALKKEELKDVFGRRDLDILEICRIWNIDPIQQNLVKFMQHLLNVEKKRKDPQRRVFGGNTGKMPLDDEDKSPKKQKTMKALMAKFEVLEKKLEERNKQDTLFEYDRAQTEAKAEATKKEVNVDILFEKLILLDNVARNINHPHKEKIAMMLSRFHAYKSKPSFVAALVLKVLCTKEEETILEKEQKLLKSLGGIDVLPRHDPNFGLPKQNANFTSGFQNQHHVGSWSPFPMWQQQFMPPYQCPSFARFNQDGVNRPRGRFQGHGNLTCFRCKKVGHIQRDCPINDK